jgi:murein DD-endopeptidase MepM/ murein hydrolase activator NlpD
MKIKTKSKWQNVCFLIVLWLLSLTLQADDKATSAQDVDLITLLQIDGELTQGSAIRGLAPRNSQLFMNDRLINTTPGGAFFIGFDRDADLQQVLLVKRSDSPALRQTLTLSKREYRVQKVEGVPQKTVSPPPEDLKRIQEENAQVAEARSVVSDLVFFLDTFKAPMDAPISGVYGSQRIYNGVPKRPHFGVDYAGPVGAPVYAPGSGIVRLAHTDMFYSGGTLIVDHGYGVSSSFLHLSEILVEVGQKVKQGDLIARVGKGGRATGPHLDWRMNWYDVRIDPLKVLQLK